MTQIQLPRRKIEERNNKKNLKSLEQQTKKMEKNTQKAIRRWEMLLIKYVIFLMLILMITILLIRNSVSISLEQILKVLKDMAEMFIKLNLEFCLIVLKLLHIANQEI